MTLPNEIQDAITNNSLVIFAGSGLSTKFELPTWKQLAEAIILKSEDSKFKDLLPLLNNGLLTPIGVLDVMESFEHRNIKHYIKDHFRIEKGQDFSLHKKILSLTNAVITTNYDNAFEEACSGSIIPTTYTSNFNISEINKSGKPYIFKLHGSYTEPDNCIIFTSSYKKLYDGDTASILKLKSIFLDKTILFIGFSFNDPDLNLIFSSLDSLFDNHNRHYILTTQATNFEKYKFLEPIKINDYNTGIDLFLENCISFKNSQIKSITPIEKNSKNEVNVTPRIVFLKPDPLNLKIDTDINSIENCFNDLDVNLFTGYLNTKTLESIDDYDILVVATKTFKGKLYIEDDILMNNLVTPEELCSHIPNDKIPIIFITDDKIDLISNFNVVNISSFKTKTINRFVFKALRNKKLDFNPSEEITIGLSSLTNLDFKKGISKKSSIYGNVRMLDIGEKSLKNIIGRIEEQGTIISKVQGIIRSRKILNIKASGGTGKTTLIKKVSYELYNRGYFKDGISFKSCENVKSYDDFEELLIEAYNLRNILSFKEYLVENYSSRKLDSLIILDNFETISNSLTDIEFNKVVRLIKFATDFANIVITSREKIKEFGDFEDLYSLAALSTDEALILFELEYGQVKDENEVRILRQDILEELLNNNPLAIKLVTKSRTRYKHVTELRDQIKEHFFESLNEDFSSVFKNKADLNVERTKSIYQSINYSYSTLNIREKIAFELLSLFPDGISLSNFKKCFEKSTSSNNISVNELRVLRDKSLVEDYNGTLQLQPMIRRFAEFQFSKRPIETKHKYCSDAYIFNCHILELLEFVERKKNTSEALKIYTHFKNNLLNVFSYIPDILINERGPIRNKEYLLNYIYELEDYVVNEKQIKEFYNKINSIKEFFNDLLHAETLIKVIQLNKRYFFEEFENSYPKLSQIFPPEELEKRVFKNEEYIENRFKDIISNLHSMEGHTLDRLKSHISNDDFTIYFDASFFYLGIPSNISGKKESFYFFEYELMFNKLNVDKLEKYIESLYLEEHLEIMQSTYTLSKTKKLDRKEITKLVVTNPYTQGLKDLMCAFISDSLDEKDLFYKKALKNLSHIKYYYLEALYFYCKYLKEIGKSEYNSLVNQGLQLSQKYSYQYIHHLFDNLYYEKGEDYVFSYSFYGISELEVYVNKHNEQWEKNFREKEIDY